MSIVHTAELAKIDVFSCLVAQQRHHEHVAKDPSQWMQWNYTRAVAQLTGRAPPD